VVITIILATRLHIISLITHKCLLLDTVVRHHICTSVARSILTTLSSLQLQRLLQLSSIVINMLLLHTLLLRMLGMLLLTLAELATFLLILFL
jgi:hypothetical protein